MQPNATEEPPPLLGKLEASSAATGHAPSCDGCSLVSRKTKRRSRDFALNCAKSSAKICAKRY